MNALINWIRNNPLSLVAIIVSSVSLIVMIWFMIGSGALKDELGESAKAIRKLQSYRAVQVDLPPSKPGESGYQASGVMVNQEAIDQVKKINQQMASESQKVIQAARSFNQATRLNGWTLKFGDHDANLQRTEMLEGLFSSSNDSLAYRSRDVYRQAFIDMLKPWRPEGPAWRLDAGPPPSPDEINARIAEVEADLFQDADRGGQDEAAARFELQQKRNALLMLFQENAQSIHVYAPTDPALMPFQIGAWINGTGKPDMVTLWEAQMQLWIQQDLAAAIAWANRVWENADPSGEGGSSVINAPIKRLLSMGVVQGYVGTHTAGGMGQFASGDSGRGGMSRFNPGSGGNARGGGQTTRQPSDRNFHVSPTGRVSNSMYDVRHATLSIFADARQLPRVFESFSKVNFMTVIDCQVQDVDEFGPDGLASGYFYGDADVVRVDLVIECVFLRNWTSRLMPDEAKGYVGIATGR